MPCINAYVSQNNTRIWQTADCYSVKMICCLQECRRIIFPFVSFSNELTGLTAGRLTAKSRRCIYLMSTLLPCKAAIKIHHKRQKLRQNKLLKYYSPLNRTKASIKDVLKITVIIPKPNGFQNVNTIYSTSNIQ